jgi:hypothetical protein
MEIEGGYAPEIAIASARTGPTPLSYLSPSLRKSRSAARRHKKISAFLQLAGRVSGIKQHAFARIGEISLFLIETGFA